MEQQGIVVTKVLLGFFISICMGRGIEISAIKMYENESEQPSLNHTTFSKHYGFQSNSIIVRASHVIQNKAFNKMGLIISSFQNKSFYNKTQKHGNIGTMQINYSSDKPNKFNNVKKVLEQKHKGICNSKTTRRVFGKNYSFSQKPTKDHKLLYTRHTRSSYIVQGKHDYAKAYTTVQRVLKTPIHHKQPNETRSLRSLKVQMKDTDTYINQKEELFPKRHRPIQITSSVTLFNTKMSNTHDKNYNTLNNLERNGSIYFHYMQKNENNTIYYHNLLNRDHFSDIDNNYHDTTNFVTPKKKNNGIPHSENTYLRKHLKHYNTVPNFKTTIPLYSTEQNVNTDDDDDDDDGDDEDDDDDERDIYSVNNNDRKNYINTTPVKEKRRIVNAIFGGKNKSDSPCGDINALTTTHKSLIHKFFNIFNNKWQSKIQSTPAPKTNTENWDYKEQSSESHYSQHSGETTTHMSLIRKFLDIAYKEIMPRDDEGGGGRIGDIIEELIHRGARAIRKVIYENTQQDSVSNENCAPHRHKKFHKYKNDGRNYEKHMTFRNDKSNVKSYSVSETSNKIDFFDSESGKTSSVEINRKHRLTSVLRTRANKKNKIKVTENTNNKENEYENKDNRQNDYQSHTSSNNGSYQRQQNKGNGVNDTYFSPITKFNEQNKSTNNMVTDWSNKLSADIQNSNMIKQEQLNLMPCNKEKNDKSNSENTSSGIKIKNSLPKGNENEEIYKQACIQKKSLFPTTTDTDTTTANITEDLLMKKAFDYSLLYNGYSSKSDISVTHTSEKITVENNVSYIFKTDNRKEMRNYDKYPRKIRKKSAVKEVATTRMRSPSVSTICNVKGDEKSKHQVTDKHNSVFTIIL